MASKTEKPGEAPAPAAPIECGLVMPISAMGDYSAAHWKDVYNILSDVAKSAGFAPRMVSDADDAGVIQGRIVTSLYECPIVICDMSGRNPNVMFELGMRLTFDKPVVLVKDDKTLVPFDVNVIEHIPYPADLRFPTMVDFKEKLLKKLKATYDNKDHTSFLKHFKITHAPSLATKEVLPDTKVILDAVSEVLSQQQMVMRNVDALGRSVKVLQVSQDHTAEERRLLEERDRRLAAQLEVMRKQ